MHGLVFLFLALLSNSIPSFLFAQSFLPQTRLASSLPGDTWEPSIAADRYGHVYVLIPDFPPSCTRAGSSVY
jgi:hypothetical protein